MPFAGALSAIGFTSFVCSLLALLGFAVVSQVTTMLQRRTLYMHKQLDETDVALKDVLRTLLRMEGHRSATSLLPPVVDASVPRVTFVLSVAGREAHAARAFGFDEPAHRLRRWAEARTPGRLAAPPALRV